MVAAGRGDHLCLSHRASIIAGSREAIMAISEARERRIAADNACGGETKSAIVMLTCESKAGEHNAYR